MQATRETTHKRMAQILVWSPNYAPELIGIPPLVTDAAEWLAERGHHVDVVTALPNYPQRRIFAGYGGKIWRSNLERGVGVHRSWLRVRPGESFLDKTLYEASFAALSAPRVVSLVRRADVLVCLVPTLMSAAAGALVARATHTRHVVWVQDLVLAAARSVHGLGRVQDGALNAMRSAESIALRPAARVITCSAGFGRYLTETGVTPDRIEMIPNWVDTDRIAVAPEAAPDGEATFLYTGNVGYTQGFDTLLGATNLVGSGVKVRIVGGGNAVDTVRGRGGGAISVEPPVVRDGYATLLASAHALVVVQRQVAANANMPSKIASYLAAGRPIVASIGIDTPAADVLRASGAALVVPPEDPAALAAAMVSLRDDAELRRTLGARGRAYAEAELSRTRILPRLERAIVGDATG